MSAGLWLGTLAASGIAGGDFESIATVTPGTAVSSIDFNSIPATYQHLQIRWRIRSGGTAQRIFVRFNGVTSASYTGHYLYGNGSAAYSGAATGATYFEGGIITTSSSLANTSGVGIMDILDYTSTTKNKVAGVFTGVDVNGGGEMAIYTGVLSSTSAITSISLIASASSTIGSGSTAALYGIKAP